PVAHRAAQGIVVALAGLLVALGVALAGLIAGLFVPLAVALLHLLHLLGHALHAAAQTFERPPLRIDSRAILALTQGAFSLAHGLLGIAQALLALHAHALHPPLQFLQPFAEGLLPLPQAERILILAALA